MDCQRCTNKTEILHKCQQCQFQFCSDCDDLIHDALFKNHKRIHIPVNVIDKFYQEQKQSVKQYFDQLIDLCNLKKQQLLQILDTLQIKQYQNTTDLKECQLPNIDPILSLINTLDFLQPPCSPRRQSAPKRSASCRKIETPIQQENLNCGQFEKRKFLQCNSHATSIQLKWTHSIDKVMYSLEFGIGMRIQGVEQFKQVYVGEQPTYIVNGLQPKTTYRFRVQVTGERTNEFSEIISITTTNVQSIEDSQFIFKKTLNQDIHVQFEKPALILGSNPIYFGYAQWEVKLLITGIVEDLTASLVVGVANKTKKIIGSTFNYGYQRESLTIKVQLNLDEKWMLVISKWNPTGERFNNIVGPIYPAFQNKNSHKGSGCKLQIQYQS